MTSNVLDALYSLLSLLSYSLYRASYLLLGKSVKSNLNLFYFFPSPLNDFYLFAIRVFAKFSATRFHVQNSASRKALKRSYAYPIAVYRRSD